jgi:acyl-CoA reductase-like NAD-dependent aldehyde dehydrogenase
MKLNDPTLLQQLAYIDGQWVPADSGATLPVTNPATGALLGSVPNMGAAETRRAIAAAAAAMPRKACGPRVQRLQAHVGDAPPPPPVCCQRG